MSWVRRMRTAFYTVIVRALFFCEELDVSFKNEEHTVEVPFHSIPS
jgi:hypothetical protein